MTEKALYCNPVTGEPTEENPMPFIEGFFWGLFDLEDHVCIFQRKDAVDIALLMYMYELGDDYLMTLYFRSPITKAAISQADFVVDQSYFGGEAILSKVDFNDLV